MILKIRVLFKEKINDRWGLEVFMTKIITFDCWGTILKPGDQTEIEKNRSESMMEVLQSFGYHPHIDELNTISWSIRKKALQQQVRHGLDTSPQDQIYELLYQLGIDRDIKLCNELIETYTTTALNILPGLMDGVQKILPILSSRFKIGMICNTNVTPGRIIRLILQKEGIFEYFNMFFFSDEWGRAKPDPWVFTHTLSLLKGEAHHSIHVGDDINTDVKGSLQVNMKAVWLKGQNQSEETPYGAVAINNLEELVKVL
jgi:FMN phosphatase YigB (HAD superfamily)